MYCPACVVGVIQNNYNVTPKVEIFGGIFNFQFEANNIKYVVKLKGKSDEIVVYKVVKSGKLYDRECVNLMDLFEYNR